MYRKENMKQKLITILNIVSQISTSGVDTMRMATCMNMLDEAIKECDSEEDINKKTDTKKAD